MLRHYKLNYHESCQSITTYFFNFILGVFFLFFCLKAQAQDPQNFTIQLEQLSFVEADQKEPTFLDASHESKKIALSPNYNYIHVTLPDDPGIAYSHKVTGETGLTDWQETGSNIHLVGLSRGEHRLCIRGERDGVVSENLLQYDIYVKAPFYLSWWFISIVLILTVLLFYAFLSLESKLLKERRDRNLQVSNLEAKAYRAQMNPHFIFNALNGMQTAMVLGGEKEFNAYITSFSKLIRDTIEMSSVDKITVEAEMKYITNYVKLQGHRLEQEIELTINIDPKIDQKVVYLPCMMLQPIVENAIVHGIIPKNEKGEITIDLLHEDGMLKISVTDNGIGREAAAKQKAKYAKHKSFATQIMRDRIDIFNYYNDRKLAFRIEDLYHDDGTAAGTKDILFVPLELKTRH